MKKINTDKKVFNISLLSYCELYLKFQVSSLFGSYFKTNSKVCTEQETENKIKEGFSNSNYFDLKKYSDQIFWFNIKHKINSHFISFISHSKHLKKAATLNQNLY